MKYLKKFLARGGVQCNISAKNTIFLISHSYHKVILNHSMATHERTRGTKNISRSCIR